ncbi:MAG: hypothetical protein V4723_16660 [Pseudomonadota bacterium]
MLAKPSTQSLNAQLAELNGTDLESMMPMSQSSLQTTREAIARWTNGSVNPVRPGGQKHVSVQQRWFAQTQRDLAAWIRDGGFGQRCEPAAAAPAAVERMLTPQLYKLPKFLRTGTTHESADACVD